MDFATTIHCNNTINNITKIMVQTRRSKRNQPQPVEDIATAVEKPIDIELIEKIDEKKNSDVLGCTDIGKKSNTDLKLGTTEKNTDSSDSDKKDDWRIKAEERRQAALAIRAAKKLKIEQQQNSGVVGTEKKTNNPQQPIVTPVTNPYSSSKKLSNPYSKKAVSSPYAAKSSISKKITQVNSPQSDIKPRKLPAASAKVVQQLPKVTSTWGDCRLDLWEETCRCGGERKAPDTRMCSCPAVLNAGLGCNGCNAGVLLIKGGPPRGFFWGCSQYKKRGCKYTKRFGPPHDRAAAQQLAELKQDSISELKQDIISKAKQEREESAYISDPFEHEWKSVCRCSGAKMLNTFECFMQSNGGCGMLPICPECTTGSLFLNRRSNGGGRWWGCSNFKTGTCDFLKNYIEHSS